uniref:Uncharacterized protein n=1 Tax=Plectus sambesii TaxID=2011161 RepID=A0A914VDH2_9BILA
MLDRSLSTRVLLLLIGWLLFFLLQFLLCCVPAAVIMTKAHAPLLTLEDLVNFEPLAHRDQEGENSNTDQLLPDDYPAAYWIGAE